MMFGLPGAALAIYHTSKAEERKKWGVHLFSVGFCSFLTGITEPLEFMFVFLARIICHSRLIHWLITGCSEHVWYSRFRLLSWVDMDFVHETGA